MHIPKLGSQVVWAQKLGCALVLHSYVYFRLVLYDYLVKVWIILMRLSIVLHYIDLTRNLINAEAKRQLCQR